jgi:sugar O-acyltransferase (sialic acid O-acetyltransferase NeuD family)
MAVRDKIFLIGGGGHCRSCIDVIESTNLYEIMGIFDPGIPVNSLINGYKVLGSESTLDDHSHITKKLLITIGQIKNPDARAEIYNKLSSKGFEFVTVISPRAYVAKSAMIGYGTIIMHDALVNANAIIGNNCILNTKALVEHDSKVKDHTHVSTAAVVNGNCIVEKLSFIGSNAIIRQGVTVPERSLVSAGSFFKGQT